MRLLNRHLAAFLALAALAAGAVYLPSRRSSGDALQTLPDLPANVAGWTRAPGAPEDILPEDPRARRNARWTYRNGNQQVWVAVGLYDSRNHPLSRPTLDWIVARRRDRTLVQDVHLVSLGGAGRSSLEVNRLAFTRGESRVDVTYWYHLGQRAIAGSYHFRLAFFLNTLLGRDEPLRLVRVAAAGVGNGGDMGTGATEQFLAAASPALLRALAN